MTSYVRLFAAIFTLGLVHSRHTDLKMEETSNLYTLSGEKDNDKIFFRVRIYNGLPSDNFLLKVTTDDPFSDPNVYMSFREKEPYSKKTSTYECSA